VVPSETHGHRGSEVSVGLVDVLYQTLV
jgi:hypothetical protein